MNRVPGKQRLFVIKKGMPTYADMPLQLFGSLLYGDVDSRRTLGSLLDVESYFIAFF